MKIGVFTALFGQRPLEEALDYIAASGLQMVEFGTGAYSTAYHCNPDKLLGNKSAQKALIKACESRGLEISAFGCHGNPLHPNKKIGREHHDAHVKSVQLAKEMGVPVVVNFSGCPGDGPKAIRPNWVTCAWPPDYQETLEWQWNEVLIPYWKEQAAIAKKSKVKVAFEIHPGFCVYNVDTMLKLREACGDALGANLDPSHLFWNGVDICAAIRKLGDAIYYFHAKDCRIDPINVGLNGCNDTTPYGDEINRSWVFRTCGYGHDMKTWKDIVSNLKMVGYDYVLSIEHEDSLMSVNEGFQKAVAFIKEVMISEQPGAMWWA